MIECHCYQSMGIGLGMVDMFACIVHQIYAINCILLDYYNVLADLDSYIGMVGTNSCVTMALDLVPIAKLANSLQSIRHSWRWLCLRIWWNLPCDVVEWTRQHGKIDRMELCNISNRIQWLSKLTFVLKKHIWIGFIPVSCVMSFEILHDHFDNTIRIWWIRACISHRTSSAVQVLPHYHWHLPNAYKLIQIKVKLDNTQYEQLKGQ